MGRRRILFSSRRRSSSGTEALAGLLIVGAIAIAVLGVYLVAVAGVAVVSLVARLVFQQTRANAGGPRLDATTASSVSAPPPESQFHVAHPVDPMVFNDPAMAEAAAVRVFTSWASKISKAPKSAADTIRSMELRNRLIGRLVTQVEGRRPIWRTAPYGGREKIGGPPINLSSIDPWNPPPDLRAASRYVASCRGCHGEGRVSCVPCGGAGRVECGSCDGGGKYYGTAANGARRLLNCKQCRGKGNVACDDCSRGRVDCPACHKTKKQECWIDIDSSVREDVQVEPDGDVTRAYSWGADGAKASREEVEGDALIVCDITRPRAISADELPDKIPPAWLAAHGRDIQPVLQPHDKVLSQTFTLLEVPAISVTYCVGTETQAIELHGRRMLAPPVNSDRLFRRRARSLRYLASVLAVVPVGAGFIYLARGNYFHSLAALGVFLAAACLALCVYGAVWNASIGRRTARRWLKATIIPVAGVASFAIVAEPSARTASGYIQAGELDRARAELGALGPRDEHPTLWAEMGLREVKGEPDLDQAIERAAAIPPGMPHAVEARHHVDQLLLSSVTRAIAENQLSVARSRLGQLSEAGKASSAARIAHGEIVLADGARCLSEGGWPCALAAARQATDLGLPARGDQLRTATISALRTRANQALMEAESSRDLASRVPAQKLAITAWSELAAVESAPESVRLADVRSAHARDVVLLAKQEEILRKKQEVADRREAAQQARAEKKRLAIEAREQRRVEAAERRAARESRSLMCNDGTESPSCTCGGSWQGCCSHHGGVDGCR